MRRKKLPKKLPKKLVEEIRGLLHKYSIREVAVKTGIPRNTIEQISREYLRNNPALLEEKNRQQFGSCQQLAYEAQKQYAHERHIFEWHEQREIAESFFLHEPADPYGELIRGVRSARLQWLRQFKQSLRLPRRERLKLKANSASKPCSSESCETPSLNSESNSSPTPLQATPTSS